MQTLPAELVVAHPELAVGAATAATMIGQAVERRRLLQLASRAEAEHPERFTPYVQAVAGMVRAAAVDTDVAEAVREGRRAVAIAEAEADAALVAALGGYARALYLAGDARRGMGGGAPGGRASGCRAPRARPCVRQVDAGARRGGARTGARWPGTTPPSPGRSSARSAAAEAGSGPMPLQRIGLVHADEGDLVEAERELASAEHFFRDEVTTVHQAWLLAPARPGPLSPRPAR